MTFFNFLTSLFPDLAEYDVPPRPKARGGVEKSNAKPISGEVHFGKLWQTEYTETGLFSESVTGGSPGVRVKELTEWDVAYLNEFHQNSASGKPTWKQSLAIILKSEWATPLDNGDYPSAEWVVRAHTASGEQHPQKGFGLSNVKKYLHAFNAAFDREVEESGVKLV